MVRLYEFFLRFYPPGHRLTFAREMSAVFAQSLQDRRKLGRASIAAFVVAELFSALREALRLARVRERSIDLTRMRPPEVSHETYGSAIDEVLCAQKLVAFNLRRMQEALAIHAFTEARFYSDQDRRASASA